MRLDASACCDNSTLRAAAQRVAALANPVLHTVREIRAAYTDVTSKHFTRAQISGTNPSGSPFVAGRIHPVDPVACTVATRLGNLSCVCGSSIAADCACPTLAHMQGAKMWLRPGDKLSGIRRELYSPLLVAVADLARQLGLISDFGVEKRLWCREQHSGFATYALRHRRQQTRQRQRAEGRETGRAGGARAS